MCKPRRAGFPKSVHTILKYRLPRELVEELCMVYPVMKTATIDSLQDGTIVVAVGAGRWLKK